MAMQSLSSLILTMSLRLLMCLVDHLVGRAVGWSSYRQSVSILLCATMSFQYQCVRLIDVTTACFLVIIDDDQ
ncbi:unnamed protein product [Amoebophrya sp. A25]|nr:unnamed protein product [Amoebophrya sp. A25]CAD7974409.1 unnamed protein product [Amoebophrya sp. A25]|eukprot:GSA25T00024987001.1